MIRIGIVDFDTSHVVAFTQRLNHIDIPDDQKVEGARVVIGCPGESKISPERVPGYTQTMRDYGVEIVDRPEEMIGRIDAVLIESVDGSVHYERALPFLEAGIPTYIDKPFTCSLAEARELARIAREKNIPLFSASSLRYALEVQEVKSKKEEYGAILGCDAYSPAPLHPRNPGLFHYGIHGVETLYALMGPGCRQVTCISSPDMEVVTGLWEDGRIGTVRGIRKGNSGYGFSVFTERNIASFKINTGYIYRELLKKIVAMFETGMPPIEIEETLEIVAFIEAALESANNGGRTVELKL